MGMIYICTDGSFGSKTKQVSAVKYGHAQAVAEAITFLSDTILPEAIAQDHALHTEQYFPEEGFSKK